MKHRNYKTSKISLRKIIISISFLLIIIIGLFVYYKSSTGYKNTIYQSRPYEPTFTKNGNLVFIKRDYNDTIKAIDIEIADDSAKRSQGLMWRHSMPDSVGMLFIFENERPQYFWMKNTYIPLDIIFINKSKEIVTIRDNTTPLSESSIPSDKPAQYVVEINAGLCNNYKIEVGDKIIYKTIKK